jgi:signal transduction histidine kinase
VDKGADYEKMMSFYNKKYVIPEERDTCTEAMRLDNVLRELDDKENCVVFFSVNNNGKILAKQVEYFYIDKGSRLIALVRTDITEVQKQQMDQRRKLQAALTEAESANEAKSDFLSRMSHDIRTPLNGIIGMTYLTEQMQLPPEARDNLRKIDTSSKFLLGLINDILDMSKAESGKLELHPEPYNEKKFVRYLDAVIAPLCREKNIKFTVDVKTVKGIDMLMDPLRINQVFFNLLSNAVKFTPEGGTVTCRLREKRTGQSRLLLTGQVSDTGVGISREFQKVIFDPFTQENRKDSSEARGSGLGLAIVKKIIDAMGGTVGVESEIGKGTVFTVSIAGGLHTGGRTGAGRK